MEKNTKKLTIRCTEKMYKEYKTICFLGEMQYGEFLKELLELYMKELKK